MGSDNINYLLQNTINKVVVFQYSFCLKAILYFQSSFLDYYSSHNGNLDSTLINEVFAIWISSLEKAYGECLSDKVFQKSLGILFNYLNEA